MMKTPVFMVTAALTVAIIVTASFLIVTGTRGDDELRHVDPAARNVLPSPAAN